MKQILINKEVYNNILFLVNNYEDNDMPPTDYLSTIQNIICIQEEHYESVVEIFLSLVQHKQLFNDFIGYFYCLGKRKDHSDKHFLMILTYFLIDVLNVANKDEIIDICQEENCQKIVNYFKFFNKGSVKERLFLIGCKYFEENYVKEKILMNIKRNNDLLEEIQNYFEEKLAVKKAEMTRELTRPLTSRVTTVMRQSLPPPVPLNTPEENLLPQAKPAPASTYKKPKISEVLEKLKDEHRAASQQLLEEANDAIHRLSTSTGQRQHNFSITNEIQHDPSTETNSTIQTQQSSSTHSEKPVFQRKKTYKSYKIKTNDVPVRKNAATILREAARLIRDEEKDIKRMNELVSGAADHSSYEEMLKQLRAEEEQLKLKDIERKHLLGQLTREEAILAKQRIIEMNKVKRTQIEKEKKETEEFLKQMRQKEEEEIKQIIDKTQQIKRNIEARKQDVIQRKHIEAQEVSNTSKQLYAEAIIRQKQELEKRIEIIKEIKALSGIKDLHANKFDPTETMNVGLLSEMSLAELYERLLLKRTSIKEEIENRQKCIRKQKLKQQQFLAETQQFIEICREQKKILCEKKDLSIKQLKVVKGESQDILELRERLERARQKRIGLAKN